MTSKAEKLEAIIAPDSGASEAERQKAQEALDQIRASNAPPLYGSAEWHKEMKRHQKMLAEAAPLLGSPSLSPAEVLTLRNWTRYVGTPWGIGADEFRRIHAKLMAEAEAEATIALAYEPGIEVELR